ncbi:MAG TPA: class I SAM-dependent methyltransferase [Solirubrobacteraceae bacterium]|nr:class I SAM-dependent methyltransferase [Solirubrobacteraceae bacterium]
MTGVDPIAARAFGTRAEQYEQGRPGWPAEAVAAVIERFEARTVLDLAAGTGKLTRILVEHASEVLAIEPVDGMRAVLERTVPEARLLDGTAEAIPLPDASLDAVFVAEAFHWFDLERAAREVARVLRPGGGLAILWNYLARDIDWADEVYDAMKAHRIDHARGPDKVPWREAIEAVFGPLRKETFDHDHVTDRERVITELSSHSSIGALPPDRLQAALDAAREVLERHGIERVAIPLRTTIYTAQKRSGDSGPSAG